MKLIKLKNSAAKKKKGQEPGKGSAAAILAGSEIANYQKVLPSSSSHSTYHDPRCYAKRSPHSLVTRPVCTGDITTHMEGESSGRGGEESCQPGGCHLAVPWGFTLI